MDAALYSRGRYSRIPDHLSEREDVVLIEKNESRIALPRPVFVFWALIGVLGIASWTVGVPGAFEGVFMDSASENSGVVVYQSSISGDRFLNMSVALFAARNILISALAFGNSFLSSSDTVGSIFIDEGERYQEIMGFGGAFTEASALNYQRLPPAARRRFMDLYFSRSNGIGYSMGRIHINSCDFCIESYSFDNVYGDLKLEYFDTSVQHDQEAIIPFIREAMATAAADRTYPSSSGPSIRLVASPWSPPAWMKVAVSTNSSDPKIAPVQSMLGSAQPNGLLADAQQIWAEYLSKFITAYSDQDVSIWAITPQNEPENAAAWEACVYTAEFEAEFITNYLGPTIRNAHPELLILGFDHNKDHLERWADVLYGAPMGTEFIDGLAFHWYNGGNDRLLDGTYGFEAIRATHKKFPQKILLATEGCSCPGILLGDWFRGERLAHDVIFDLNNWANGWIDWNLIVDSQGGPNHLNNYCDSPLVATADFTDFIVQPKYFFMGHFSKFIPSGSIRIKSHIVGNFSNVLDSPNIQSGVELGIFPCEDSSRQLWEINNSRIALAIPAFSDVQIEDSTAVRLCISLGNTPQSYLQVKACSVLEGNDNSLQFIPVKLQLSTMPSSVKSRAGHFSVYQLRQKVLSGSSELCFGVDQASQNGEDGGALLKLGFCSVSDLSQLWAFQDISVTDTVSLSQYMLHKKIISIAMSSAEESSCLTAGWPFLTGTAFSTPDGASGVVVMNESPSLTKYELKTARSSAALDLGISARSIQTIMFPL